MDRLKARFRRWCVRRWASDDAALDAVRIERLAEAGASDIHWAKDVYGTLEERGQTPVPRPLATLNTALAEDGVLIHVTGKAANRSTWSMCRRRKPPTRCCTMS